MLSRGIPFAFSGRLVGTRTLGVINGVTPPGHRVLRRDQYCWYSARESEAFSSDRAWLLCIVVVVVAAAVEVSPSWS